MKKGKTINQFNDKNYELLTLFCFRVSQVLRNKIKYSESKFRMSLETLLPTECKEFYCYWTLNEIEKFGISSMRIWKMVKEEGGKIEEWGTGDRIARNVLESMVDEQNLWARKLVELLVYLILFFQNNKEIYFEHYILANRHQSYHRRYNSHIKFFSCNRIRDKEQQKKLAGRMITLESMSSFDIDKAWYLNSRKDWTNRTGKNKSKLKNFEPLFVEALKIAGPDQKIILGGSYENFSRLSRSIHPSVGGPTHPVALDTVFINIMGNSILAGHIQLMIKRLFDIRAKKGALSDLQRLLVSNKYPIQLFRRKMQTDIKKGDLVVAENEICEVVGVTKNGFGYKSFEVLFLERQDNHPCKKDNYRGSELTLVAKRKKLIEDTKKLILKANPQVKLHGNSFIKSYRERTIRLWNIIKGVQK